jgi:hypothetical protein
MAGRGREDEMRDVFYLLLIAFLGSVWIEQPTLPADVAKAISAYAKKVQP